MVTNQHELVRSGVAAAPCSEGPPSERATRRLPARSAARRQQQRGMSLGLLPSEGGPWDREASRIDVSTIEFSKSITAANRRRGTAARSCRAHKPDVPARMAVVHEVNHGSRKLNSSRGLMRNPQPPVAILIGFQSALLVPSTGPTDTEKIFLADQRMKRWP